jgi:ATP-binding cassette subfamily B multidrug efflux pump
VIRLMRFLKPVWLAAAAAPLCMTLEVAMDLMQPALMSDIIDRGVAAGNLPYVLAMGGRMLLFALIGMAGGTGCMALSSVAAMSFGTGLRQAAFDKIQAFSFAELDTLKTSSLITRLTNDVMQMQQFVMMMLRIMVRAPLLCVGGIVMAYLINAKLAMILLVSMPILVVGISVIVRKGFPLFRVMQDRIDRINDVTRENLSAVRVVKVYVRQEHEQARFDRANDSLMEAGVRASRTMIWLWPVLSVALNGSVVAALWFGGRMFMAGGLQTGEIMAFINYLMQILMSLMMTAMMLLGASRAKASADRINEVLDTESTITNPGGSPAGADGYSVEFRGVSFRYPSSGGEPALRGVSFTAREGQTIGILGPTGSGKSTLVSLIPRLYDATEGQVLVGGADVRDIPLEKLRGQIVGMALQESILFTGTVEENLRWGNGGATMDKIEQAAADAQAHDFIHAMDEGYSAMIGQRGVNFSGGQKQRLSIARALIKNPQILILDDSTSAVDMATEARLQEALRRRMGSCTVFVIAQRISSVMEADKILVMEDGRIAAQGTHGELIRSSELYRDIVRSQLGEEAAHG